MSKYLQFKQVEKRRILFFFFLMISFQSFSQADWVTWQSQSVKSNQLQGSVNLNGETVNVSVQVTSTNKQANWYDFGIENDVIVSGNYWQVVMTELGALQPNLGVNSLTQMAMVGHSYNKRPNVLTITFDKAVVIETLSFADVDVSSGGWTDGHSISGYQFASVESGGFQGTNPQPTITTSGVSFAQNAYSDDSVGDGYVRYRGKKLIQPSETLIISYDSIVSSKNGKSAGNGNSSFALKLQKAMGKISGKVLEDTTGDKQGNTGISNVTLSLYQNGQPVTNNNGVAITTQTSNDGSYLFDEVIIGTYAVRQANLNGYLSVSDKDGGNKDEIANITVIADQNNTGNNFIDTKPGQLSGSVLEDIDGDKVGDKGIGGVSLLIKNTNGFSQTVTTQADGSFQLGNLEPTTYTIQQMNANGFYSATDSDGVNDDLITATVLPNQTSSGHQFVDFQLATVKGTVKDTDGNGLVTQVQLTTITGQIAKDIKNQNIEVTSSADGSYTLENILPGDYIIKQIDLPNYYSLADEDSIKDSDDDNDINGSQVDSELSASLKGGEVDTGNDFVDYQVGQIKGNVKDTKGVGIQGVTVTLKKLDNSVAQNRLGVDLVSTTDSNGAYSFAEIVPGVYKIVQTDLDGYSSVSDSDDINDGIKDKDENTNTNDNELLVEISTGEVDTGNNFVDKKKSATVSGSVKDTDGNGIENATVSIKTVFGQIAKDLDGNNLTVLTNAQGKYLFVNIPVGSYVIEVDEIANYTVESDADIVKDGADDNDINGSQTDKALPVDLVAGEVDTGNQFVFKRILPGTVKGVVLEDNDGNGTGDTGIEKVTVTISNQSGFTKAVQTSADGAFVLSDIAPGNYTLTQTNLAGYYSKSDSDGVNDDKISVTIEAGKTSSGHQFIDFRTATVSGKVTNLQGVGLSTPVQLQTITGQIALDKDGNQLKTQSAADGSYTLTNILPGDYIIKQIDLVGYYSIQDNDAVNDGDLDNDINASQVDSELAVRLQSGEQDTGNNFVDDKVSTISGKVLDTDDNGLANVTLYLKNLDGSIAKDQNGKEFKVFTNADGSYLFQNVVAGEYYIEQIDLPTYFSLLEEDVVNDGANDDDVDTVKNDNKLAVKISSGSESDSGNYFVDYQVGKISGSVKDKNGNGISGVSVSVKNADGSVAKNRLNQDMTAVTLANGSYEFTDVRPGSYYIEAIDKDGYVSVSDSDDVKDEARDDDKNENTNDNKIPVEISTGEVDTGNNFVDQLKTATVKGKVQELAGKGGLFNVVVTMKTLDGKIATDESGSPLTTKTLVDGSYEFTNVPVGSYYIEETDPDGYVSVSASDTVKDSVNDTDVSTSANNNRIAVALVSGEVDTGNVFIDQKDIAGVSGIIKTTKGQNLEGVTISLLDSNGQVVKDAQGNDVKIVTGADGKYSFMNIPSGNYSIQASDILGYTFAKDSDEVNDGNDDTDTNTSETDKQLSVHLIAGEMDTGNNFYYKKWAVVKGTVKDVNGSPIEGGTVSIKDVITNKVVNSALNQPLTTTTKADGTYSFYYIPAGDYFIESKDLDGYVSKFDGDEIKDSDEDVDPNGNQNDNVIPVSLSEGEVDTGNNFVDISTTTITGGVMTDTNNDGVGDQPMPGVKVKLLDKDKNPVMVDSSNPTTRITQKELIATTNEQGIYTFYNVAPGTYYIQQIQPEDYTSTGDAQGEGTDNLIEISVLAGQQITGQNFVEVENGRALPVDLVSFNAIVNGRSVSLTWVTATEKDNSHFEIERSLNGVHFDTIGKVQGVGTSDEENQYEFSDTEVLNQQSSIAYYRLKQVDFSGAIEYSSIVSIQLPSDINENQFVAYPNPVKARSQITIEFKDLEFVQIYNLQGQLQKELKFNKVDLVEISTENLPTGEYILTINGSQSKTIVITK